MLRRWRAWRLSRAELALADIRYYMHKRISMSPSCQASCERRIERLERRVERLGGGEQSDG